MLPAAALGTADAVEGSEVRVGDRFEKVRVRRDGAPPDRIALRGRVHEVACYGETGRVFVALDGRQPISVDLRNVTRSTAPAVSVGEERWCSWSPGDTLVLADRSPVPPRKSGLGLSSRGISGN